MNQEIALNQSKTPVPLPNGLPLPQTVPIELALGAFREALDAWASTITVKENAKIARAQIRAQAETQRALIEAQIKNMELATRRGMAADQEIHEQRMELICYVGKLLVDNAQTLTPEIISSANMLLTYLREVR